MSEDTLKGQGQGSRMVTAIVICVISFTCIAALVTAIVVVVGEIPWHHVFACGCG